MLDGWVDQKEGSCQEGGESYRLDLDPEYLALVEQSAALVVALAQYIHA